MEDETPSRPTTTQHEIWDKNRRSSKMAERLARQMIDDLVSAGSSPGDKLLSETEMSSRYDVARSTLREALRLLEVQGLIRMKRGPGGGPILSELTPADFAQMAKLHLQMRGSTFGELFAARMAMEPLMARLAAEAQDPGGLLSLRRVVEESDHLNVDDEAEFQQNATNFHVVLASMSGNSVLDLLGASLQEVYQTGVKVKTPLGRRKTTRGAHHRIAAAVFEGDADLAEQLMREHMEDFDRAKKRSHLQSVQDVERIRWE